MSSVMQTRHSRMDVAEGAPPIGADADWPVWHGGCSGHECIRVDSEHIGSRSGDLCQVIMKSRVAFHNKVGDFHIR